jgi:5'-methylthioadenosine phosphorylase
MAKRIGIIGGTNLVTRVKELDMERVSVETPYGKPSSPLLIGSWGGVEVALLVRHGLDHTIPPHRLNHHANIEALRAAGVEKLVLVASAGSLDKHIKPPTIVVLTDFVSPFTVPTYFDDRIEHIAPFLSERMRSLFTMIAAEKGIKVMHEGVYVQMNGPRLETRAEIRMVARWGDVVGMTLASEATLALERGMNVAALASVDNMAHGLADEALDFETIKANASENWYRIERLLAAVLPKL